jgi:hypothetical protein
VEKWKKFVLNILKLKSGKIGDKLLRNAKVEKYY